MGPKMSKSNYFPLETEALGVQMVQSPRDQVCTNHCLAGILSSQLKNQGNLCYLWGQCSLPPVASESVITLVNKFSGFWGDPLSNSENSPEVISRGKCVHKWTPFLPVQLRQLGNETNQPKIRDETKPEIS